MSVQLSEIGYVGELSAFTRSQQQQMAHWLDYDTNISHDPGIVGTCELILARSNQGSSFYMADKIIRALIDERTGLDGRKGIEDAACIALLDGGRAPCNLLDSHFFNYLDGSITVGYDHTGFMLDLDNSSVVIHPATRFSIQLPEQNYDLSYSQKAVGVTGRTLFFYRLTQACQSILASAANEKASQEPT